MNKPSKYNAERNLMVHSNFSFDYISWEHWSSATVANSLFNGSIFENCIFENIAFNNADLEGTRSITLQITYEEQPEIPLVEILSAMMPNYKRPIQIKTERGSFIEYIEAMSASLPYIDVFLALIGVIVPIVSEVRATKRAKKEDPHPPSTESTNVIIPAIYLSPGITVNAQSEVVSAVKVIVEYNIVIDKRKKGYNQSNVKRIKVISKS